ncbi:S41 family peptidase [Candidatus Falkowbacteria bacterium]|nr:S41 family peptidase [Candidatus Falkowbacteria bacterium]
MFQRSYSLGDKATRLRQTSARQVHKFWLLIAIGITVAVISFSIGFFVSRASVFVEFLPTTVIGTGQQTDFPKIFEDNLTKQLWQIIKQGYLRADSADPQKMYYGALMGFVAGLGDPYTMFFDPDMTKEFEIEIKGTFTGIGAEVGLRDGQVTVIAPLPASPAEKVGLKPGDKIFSIDGKETLGMSLDEAIKLIRGKKGTIVKLLIIRDTKTPFEISIVRDDIKIKSTNWKMLDNNILYLAIHNFNGDTRNLLDEMLKKIDAATLKGIVLDLRNNPGGLLDASIDVASLWIDNKVVVQEKAADQKIINYETKGKAKLQNVKTIVLVNGGTASGAEILAGALQDYKIAKLVGEKTFGKGSVQTFLKLENGTALKMTIAEWLTPNGQQIDKIGIEPDNKVVLTDEDFKNNKDPQLEAAIKLFK